MLAAGMFLLGTLFFCALICGICFLCGGTVNGTVFPLVERMDKRCAFLENAAAILGLNNVIVLKSEAEKVSPESFDIATFRAFRPLDKKMAKTLLNLTAQNGFLAAYKAKKESITEEMNAISDIIPEYKSTIPVQNMQSMFHKCYPGNQNQWLFQ